jgi:hypothetical protein
MFRSFSPEDNYAYSVSLEIPASKDWHLNVHQFELYQPTNQYFIDLPDRPIAKSKYDYKKVRLHGLSQTSTCTPITGGDVTVDLEQKTVTVNLETPTGTCQANGTYPLTYVRD